MPTDLPNLSPEETDLLATLLITDAPLADVATRCDISIIDAVRILARTHVQAHLIAARDAARKRFQARAADLAPQALLILKDVAATTEIPAAAAPAWDDEPSTPRDRLAWQTERRRAATTIIRAATPRQPDRPSKRHRASRAPDPAATPNPPATSPDLTSAGPVATPASPEFAAQTRSNDLVADAGPAPVSTPALNAAGPDRPHESAPEPSPERTRSARRILARTGLADLTAKRAPPAHLAREDPTARIPIGPDPPSLDAPRTPPTSPFVVARSHPS